MKKKVIIIVLAIILVLGAITAGLYIFRTIGTTGNVTQENSEVQVATLNRVCDSKIVDTYNNVMNYLDRGDGGESSLDESGIRELKEDINTKDGSQNDPTCQTILFWIAVHYTDYESAKKAYTAVVDLHDKGMFADSNLGSAAPLFVFKSNLDSLLPEGQKGE